MSKGKGEEAACGKLHHRRWQRLPPALPLAETAGPWPVMLPASPSVLLVLRVSPPTLDQRQRTTGQAVASDETRDTCVSSAGTPLAYLPAAPAAAGVLEPVLPTCPSCRPGLCAFGARAAPRANAGCRSPSGIVVVAQVFVPLALYRSRSGLPDRRNPGASLAGLHPSSAHVAATSRRCWGR